MGAIFVAGVGPARGSGHKGRHAGIFEFESGTAAGCSDIIGPADHRQRMQMQTMLNLRRHDVDPAIRHRERSPLQIKIQMRCELQDVSADLLFQLGEGGGKSVKLGIGTVGRVTARVIFFAPASTGIIEITQLVAFIRDLVVGARQSAALQRGLIDKGGKPGLDGGHVRRVKPRKDIWPHQSVADRSYPRIARMDQRRSRIRF